MASTAPMAHQQIADALVGMRAAQEDETRAIAEKYDRMRAHLRGECGKAGHIFAVEHRWLCAARACVVCDQREVYDPRTGEA